MQHPNHKTVDEVVYEMREGLRPAPPPTAFKVEPASTFSMDVSKGRIFIPKWHNKKDVWPVIHEYVVHEFNHGRICGIPYSFLEQKRLEAAIMSTLSANGEKCSKGKASGLLNTIGDIVNDVYIHGQTWHGHTFDMRKAQEVWVKRFPPTGKNPRTNQTNTSTTTNTNSNGSRSAVSTNPKITSYYILCLLYQHFVGGNILKDTTITSMPQFRELTVHVKNLINQARTLPEEKDTKAVTEAARLIDELSDEVDEETCISGRPATQEELEQIAQYAVEYGLTASQLQDLVDENNLSRGAAEELLHKAMRLRSAEMVYKAQVGFREYVGGAGEPIYAPSTRKFRPSDRDVSVESVALYPHDQRRWRRPTKYVITTVPTKYDRVLGFKKVIGILDNSGSTSSIYQGRPVLTHEWDVLASLVGFVLDNRLKFDVYVYNSLLIPVNGTPMEILSKVMRYGPAGSTNLGLPLRKIKDETDTLIVIITDGEVEESDVELIEPLAKHNKVIGMIVNDNYKGTAIVDTRIKGFTLYTANPSGGQRIIFSELKGLLK
jgi:hypothetical protein